MGLRAAHFGEGHHFLDRRRDVDGGVYGEGDDLGQRDLANAFDLRQTTQADECGILVQNEIDRNRFEIFSEPPFFFKTRTKLRAGKIFGHVTQNASGNKYPAPRTEREREIAGDRPEHRAEHVGGSAARRTGPRASRPG